MDIRHKRQQPETTFSQELRAYMRVRDWHTEKTHGSMFMVGWPDLYAAHTSYGTRWIETKVGSNKLTRSQINKFNQWAKYGIGIWVLKSVDEYMLLFKEPNWRWYI